MKSLLVARCPLVSRFLILVAALGMTSPADAQLPVTALASSDAAGNNLSASSYFPEISADGRFVVFETSAALDPADLDFGWDIYVKDTQTGAVELVSVSSAGVKGDAASKAPSISNDGNFVSFHSDATNLVPGPSGPWGDVYVRNRALNTTARVSQSLSGSGGNGESYSSWISATGRFVVFNSFASDLVVGDTNDQMDVYIADLELGTTEIVSVDSQEQLVSHISLRGRCSMDGRFVVFQSVSPDLVPNDSNQRNDIFVRDRMLGTTERVSTTATGFQSNQHSSSPSISDDGSLVVFSTKAVLVPGDSNSANDIYSRNLLTGDVERISEDSLEGQSNGYSNYGLISPSGNFVTFSSTASNLVPGDVNGTGDVFLRDLKAGTTERINMSSSAQGANQWSDWGSCSDDGRFVCYESSASNLVAGDVNGNKDVFLFDRRTGGSTLDINNFFAGQVATVQGSGLTPGAPVFLGFTLSGQGSFGSAFGIIRIAPPVVLIPLTADSAGDVTLPVGIPPGVAGLAVFSEGLDLVSGLRTSLFAGTVL